MSTPTTRAGRAHHAHQVASRMTAGHGWRPSDADQIEQRRRRGSEGDVAVTPLEGSRLSVAYTTGAADASAEGVTPEAIDALEQAPSETMRETEGLLARSRRLDG